MLRRSTSCGEPLGGHVAAGDRHADPEAAASGTRPAISAASAQAPRRLGHGLEALEQEPHGVDDLGVAWRARLVDALADDLEGELAGVGSCWPSAIVRGTWIRTRSPASSERLTSSPASGSTPTTRTSRHASATVAQPAISPPPPTQHEQQVERAGVLDQLERDRALAGHHALVVVRVDRHEPALGDQLGEQLLAVLPRSGRSGSPRRRGPRWRPACPPASPRASGSRPGCRAAARRARAPARGCRTTRSPRRARAPRR